MMKMKFDEVDIGIIHFLKDNPSKTTTEIAKKIFETKSQNEIKKQDALVRLRVTKLVEMKLLLTSLGTPKTFTINPEFVCCGEGVLNLKVNGGKKMDINFGSFLIITDTSNFVYLRRISENDDKDMPKIIS